MAAKDTTMVRFPITSDLLYRLPRHPDWKYEMIEGEARLSPRPVPFRLWRPTALAVPAAPVDAEVRTIEDRDRARVAALLTDVWAIEDPYRSFEDPEAQLRVEIERSLKTLGHGAVAIDSEGIRAAVLVSPQRSGPPMLEWLSVRRDARERGLATALLALLVGVLQAAGVSQLHSGASPANLASLRWHLTRGFQLSPDPIREALRGGKGDA